MKSLVRIFVITLVVSGLVPVMRAQEGPSRLEYECLMMSKSNRQATPGDKSTVPTFHHVWMPGYTYGYFESNGLKLSYEMEGVGDETLVVVHGGPGLPHDYFHPMLSSLGKFTRVVYFDRRADTLSTRSGHGVASIEEMADDVDALRQALGVNRVTVLGHSFGGAIALTYALRHPEHVNRLILVNTAAYVENPREVEKRILKTLSPKEQVAFRSNEGNTGGGNPCDRVRRQYRVLYPSFFHRSPNNYRLDSDLYAIYFDALAKKQALASNAEGYDVRSRLGEIKAPVLVLGGRHDVVNPLEQVSELAGGLPQARLVVMEHSGHFPFVEENYMFSEWVRHFFNSTRGANENLPTSATGSE